MGIMNLHDIEKYVQNITNVTLHQLYFIFVAFGWNTLKCISFSADKIKDDGKSLHFNLMDFLGYAFYPPTLFMGPHFNYEKYREMLLNYGKKDDLKVVERVTKLAKVILLCYGVYLFLQFCLHFLYLSNFTYYDEKVSEGHLIFCVDLFIKFYVISFECFSIK